MKRWAAPAATMLAGLAMILAFGAPRLVGADEANARTFTPTGPSRLLDTRTTNKVPAGGTVDVFVGTGLSAAAVNITVTDPEADGFITAYATGSGRPNASSVNYVTGQTVPNFAIVPVGPTGQIRLYTLASTHLLVDVTGTFAGSGSPTPPGPTNVSAAITGYQISGSGNYTTVSGTATNSGSATVDVRVDLRAPTGATSTQVVYDLAPGSTGAWSWFTEGAFTSGATILRVYV